MSDKNEEFDWTDLPLVIRQALATTVYTNPDGEIVIRQACIDPHEEDSVIVIPRDCVDDLIKAIRDEEEPDENPVGS